MNPGPLLLAGLLLAPSRGAGSQEPPAYDILIRGGRLLDGTGNPWRRADVAIKDGRVVALGRLNDPPATVVLDASDLYVAPGFIDVHSHAAEGLGRPELAEARPILAQGVTTLVLNPDGGGPWPLSDQRLLYERQGIGPNAALMVGHGTVRQRVLGMEDRPATPAELERMKALVREGMAAGAFGLSSGLYYAPGSYASTEEVAALAREVAPAGGLYSSHIRDEGDYTVGLLAAVEEVIAISEAAGLPGIVTHFKALGPDNWGKSVAACLRIERARARGLSVWADQYPYEASGTSVVGALVPRWAQAGGEEELLRRLRDPGERRRLREDLAANLRRRGGPATLVVSRFIEDPSLEGRSLAEVAAERNLDPVDFALELLEAGDAGLVSFNMAERDVEHIMVQDYTMTCSDGGLVTPGEGKPHPRYYGTFPRKIRRFVLERGTLGLAAAVRSMTSLAAAVFNLEDRGLLIPGAWADLVVFDLARLRDRATYSDPHQLAEGVVHLVVNGKLAIHDGRFTGALSGKVLQPRQP
jgi:N-acyl-D-aspartate/D-glutamate deacylase